MNLTVIWSTKLTERLNDQPSSFSSSSSSCFLLFFLLFFLLLQIFWGRPYITILHFFSEHNLDMEKEKAISLSSWTIHFVKGDIVLISWCGNNLEGNYWQTFWRYPPFARWWSLGQVTQCLLWTRVKDLNRCDEMRSTSRNFTLSDKDYNVKYRKRWFLFFSQRMIFILVLLWELTF